MKETDMFKTLKGRISFIYLCLVLIIAIVGFASVLNLFVLNKAIDGLMSANYKSIGIINSMLEAIERQDSAVLGYISVEKQAGIDKFIENQNAFTADLNAEKNNITEPGEKELVDRISESYGNYVKMFFKLQEIRNSQGEAAAIAYYDSDIAPEFAGLKQNLRAILQVNEKAMFQSKDNATESAKNSTYIILLLTAIMMIGGFFASRFFANRFLQPIYNLIDTVKLVKAGDLNQQATVISKDEIGELALEFNNMTKRLLQFEKSALGSMMSEKNRFIAVVKNISDPLLVLDNSYKITILNNACETFFDISEEKAISKHFLEVIRNGELFDHISGEFNDAEDRREKIIQVRANDAEYFLNVVVTTVKDVENNLNGLIVLFQNVTALKQLEKIRTDFIATISHEFRTPLTSIMMGTDLLLNEGMGSLTEDQASVASAIKEDCDRLSTLVNDIMELTKLESGRAVFNPEPCSIVGIIENTYRQFKPFAEQKNVNLEFDAAEDLPPVFADYEKIRWVLNNLVSNALKYTNAGDDVMISASVRNDEMVVSVRDTGMGIPEEYTEKIFNRFFQVKGNDLEIRGAGLGLSVSKEIIEGHGGRIWCESRLDQGSTFTFTVKLSK